PDGGDAPPVNGRGDAMQVPGGMVVAPAATGGAPEASGAALARAAPLACRASRAWQEVTAVLLPSLTLRWVAAVCDRSEVCTRVPANAHDRELTAQLLAGDEAALRTVYREHASAVFGLAMRVLANATLAEETTQDVFVRLWE